MTSTLSLQVVTAPASRSLSSPDGSRSTDGLGEAIAELAARLHAATYELLVLLREFDERAGWNCGFLSCAHWLHWRTGIDLREAASAPSGAVMAEEVTFGQRRADALGLLAETALSAELDHGVAGERYQVVLHVDATASARDRAARGQASRPACGSAGDVLTADRLVADCVSDDAGAVAAGG